MKVRYERLFSFGNYENEKIGFEVDVKSEKQAKKELAKLFFEVEKAHQIFDERRKLAGEIGNLEYGIEDTDNRIKYEQLTNELKHPPKIKEERTAFAHHKRTLRSLSKELARRTRKLKKAQRELAKIDERIKAGRI